MDEKKIQWAIDELEIRNVIASLAVLSDLGEIEDWGNLFADDGMYTTASGSASHGRDAIIESGRQRRGRGTHGPASGNRHFSGSVLVRQTGPDTAEAQSYLLMFMEHPDGPAGEESDQTGPTMMVLGYYHDRFRRTSDGWKVAHRELAHSTHTAPFREVLKSWT